MSDIDPMLLELFQAELETQTAALADGLIALEANPSDPKMLAAVMRAAHSLKGAARISGLDPIVEAAHALEDAFVAAQEGKLDVSPELIDLGLEANDWFKSASSLAPDKLAQGLATQSAKAAEIAAKVRAVMQADSAQTQPAAPPEPTPAKQAKEPEPEEEEAPWEVEDSLLDLLKAELEVQAGELSSGLLAFERNGPQPEVLASLMRAAHSVKGAGRIVGFDPMVHTAHVIEDFFEQASQSGDPNVDPWHIDKTFAFCDLLSRAAAAEMHKFKATLMGLVPDFRAITKALKAGAPAASVAPPATPTPTSGTATEAPQQAAPIAQTHAPTSQAPESRAAPPHSRSAEERSVKVAAETINQIMAYAAEIMVEAGQFEAVVKDFQRLRRTRQDLTQALDRLQGHIRHDPQTQELIAVIREQVDKSRASFQLHIEQLEASNARSVKLSGQLYQEALSSRMRPFSEGVQGFPRLVRDLARTLSKRVRYELVGATTKVDRDVLAKLEAPINHILRNAMDHGMEIPKERLAAGKPEEGRITLAARHRAGMLMVTVTDDGRGISTDRVRKKVVEKSLASAEITGKLTDAEVLEFLFLPGFSTAGKVTEISGRGVGLDVVQNMVHAEGGSVRITSEVGTGSTFHLQLPVTRSVTRAMITLIAGEPYGFPLARIERVLVLDPGEVRTVEGRAYLKWEDDNIGIVAARDVLELEGATPASERLSLVVLREGNHRYALEVDRILGERDCVVRPMDIRLGKVPDISAISMMEDGSPLFLIDADDMIRSIDTLLGEGRVGGIRKLSGETQASGARRVLVVDDSITVREIERKLLERNGYEVDVAVDGMEGWNAARLGQYDLIVSDVDMPRMNGIEFIKKLRKDTRLAAVPVIIVSYKDRESDRLLGMEAGASQYLTKSSFQDESFIRCVRDLLGE